MSPTSCGGRSVEKRETWTLGLQKTVALIDSGAWTAKIEFSRQGSQTRHPENWCDMVLGFLLVGYRGLDSRWRWGSPHPRLSQVICIPILTTVDSGSQSRCFHQEHSKSDAKQKLGKLPGYLAPHAHKQRGPMLAVNLM